jgi:pheromone shutdown-related protein TraB
MDPDSSARDSAGAAPTADSSDVCVVEVGSRTFVLVGTAHVSRESLDLVRQVIERERPDCVCVELDERRYAALSQEHSFDDLDLRSVIRQRQLVTLMLNLVLAAYQRQLGLSLGVMPGAELLEAARVARENGIPVELCDRDVRITLRRAWRAMRWWRRFILVSFLFASLFERPSLKEEDLRELRRQDVLSQLLRELGEAFPGLKSVLIDERDLYLAQKLLDASGDRVVAVVGAGHVEGVRRALSARRSVDLAILEAVPPASRLGLWLGWGVPAVIAGALVAIGLRQGVDAVGENLLFWILANGIPSFVGAVLALAHPATMAVAFLAAPVTSLTPVIGVGYVTAAVQTYFRPPRVREIQGVPGDLGSLRGWWRNRMLRIFLVLLLTTLGSLLGTWVGGAEIISNLF